MSSRCPTPVRSALAEPRPTEAATRAGFPRRWVAGLCVLAVVLGGAVTWALVRDPSYVARPPSTSAPQARPAAAAAALQSLAEALAAGDAEAAAALAPPGDTAAAASLRAVARNARAPRDLTPVPLRRRDGRRGRRWVLVGGGRRHLALRPRLRDRARADRGDGRPGARRPGRRRRDGVRHAGCRPAPRLALRSGRRRAGAADPGRARGERRARSQPGRPLPAPGRAGRRRGAPGAAGLAGAARGRGAGLERGPGPGPGRRARAHPRDRGRDRARGRLDGDRLAGARVRQPGRLRPVATDRGAGGARPRGRARRDATPLAATWSRGCSRASPTTSRSGTWTCP